MYQMSVPFDDPKSGRYATNSLAPPRSSFAVYGAVTRMPRSAAAVTHARLDTRAESSDDVEVSGGSGERNLTTVAHARLGNNDRTAARVAEFPVGVCDTRPTWQLVPPR
jgi:hypothetical protein